MYRIWRAREGRHGDNRERAEVDAIKKWRPKEGWYGENRESEAEAIRNTGIQRGGGTATRDRAGAEAIQKTGALGARYCDNIESGSKGKEGGGAVRRQ